MPICKLFARLFSNSSRKPDGENGTVAELTYVRLYIFVDGLVGLAVLDYTNVKPEPRGARPGEACSVVRTQANAGHRILRCPTNNTSAVTVPYVVSGLCLFQS